MNQADKAEALRLIASAEAVHGTQMLPLRALIERQPDDTDGEMWRFCRKHGFPKYSIEGSDWRCWVGADSFVEGTPAEAVQAAMAAMNGQTK